MFGCGDSFLLFSSGRGEFDFHVPSVYSDWLCVDGFLCAIGSVGERDETEASGFLCDLIHHDNGVGDGSELSEYDFECLVIDIRRYASDEDFIV